MEPPKTPAPSDVLKIAVTSRVLFNLESEHRIYEEHGVKAFEDYQMENRMVPIPKGPGFKFVADLLKINELYEGKPLISVTLVSRNSGASADRVANTIRHYGLGISQMFFTGGRDVHPFLHANETDLFLSMNQHSVDEAIKGGVLSSLILPIGDVPETPHGSPRKSHVEAHEVRIAFDGDAVLFSDESQRVYDARGLKAFQEHEHERADVSLPPGPFKTFLSHIINIQRIAIEKDTKCPIRTYLVTARGFRSIPRVFNTFHEWGMRTDEVYTMDGKSKLIVLNVIKPHIFFDDNRRTVEKTASAGVASAVVMPPMGSDE